MSISDDKRGIFSTIGSYTSISKNNGKIPLQGNTYASVNNKNDVIPFLVDILKVSVGSEAVKLMVGDLLTKFLNKTESKSKTILKKQFIDSNSDKQVSSDFINNGYSVSASKIDINKKTQIKETSTSYPLYRNDTIPTFENSIHDAVRLEPTAVNYSNTTIVSYNKTTDEFIFKSAKSNYLVSNYVNDYINNTTILNKKEIHTNIMNSLFGSISSNENKTVSQISNELQVDKILSQVINGNGSYNISQQDLDALFNTATNISNGVSYIDLGCGLMQSSLNINDLSNLISQISGSTDSFGVANALQNTLINNTNLDPNTLANNTQTIKDNFFKQIINALVLSVTKALTTAPQIRALIAITSAFKGKYNVLDGDISSSLINSKAFIDCMVKELINMISEFIYNKVITVIKNLIKPILTEIAKEKINLYSSLIKSLVKPVPT